MTVLAHSRGLADSAVPGETVGSGVPVGSTAGRLLRFAIANIARRPDRFLLATAGIALAVMAVTVVRTVSVGFASSGSDSLTTVLRGAPLWVVPAQGVHYDPGISMLTSDGPPPAVRVPSGWQSQSVVTGVWSSPAGKLALLGRDDIGAGHAVMGGAAASTLGVRSGGTVRIGGRQLSVSTSGSGKVVYVASALATSMVGDKGWVTVTPPEGDRLRHDLGALVAASSGLPSTKDPARSPNGRGLIFDTSGGTGSLTFAQRYSARFSGQVTSSALGMVSTVGLVLGFVIAVTSFLASVQERRREFGIMSSIGLADEVLYFFLVESAIVFLVAYVVGALAAGAAVALVIPGIATFSGWLQAAGTVVSYLPAMAIVGALVPVHRLLQQRPVALLADQS